MLEKDVEAYLKEKAWSRGWGARKFTSPARRNVPDQILTVPSERFPPLKGLAVFVECKRPGTTLTAGQQREHARLREEGQLVFTVDSYEAVDTLFVHLSERYR